MIAQYRPKNVPTIRRRMYLIATSLSTTRTLLCTICTRCQFRRGFCPGGHLLLVDLSSQTSRACVVDILIEPFPAQREGASIYKAHIAHTIIMWLNGCYTCSQAVRFSSWNLAKW